MYVCMIVYNVKCFLNFCMECMHPIMAIYIYMYMRINIMPPYLNKVESPTTRRVVYKVYIELCLHTRICIS